MPSLPVGHSPEWPTTLPHVADARRWIAAARPGRSVVIAFGLALRAG